MRKIFLFLILLFSLIKINAQNQPIVTGQTAESFGFLNPVDSLNFVTATTKVNGVGVWKKVNLGSIKTYVNSDAVSNTVVNAPYTVAATGNTALAGNFIKENGNTFITCFVDKIGVKHEINKKSFTSVGNTGVILPNYDPNSDFKGAFVREQNNTYITAYVDIDGRRWAIGPDLSNYLTATQAANIYETKAESQSNYNYGKPILGEVTMFAGSNIPANYLMCDGRMLSKTDYSALYSTISGQFGENSDSFRLPNLTEKFVKGGTDRGQTGGADSVTLTEGNLPSHTHAVTGEVKVAIADQPGSISAGAGNVLGKVAQDTGTATPTEIEVYVGTSGRGAATFNEGNKLGGVSHNLTTATAGQGQAFSITPSYIVLSYIIRVQ